MAYVIVWQFDVAPDHRTVFEQAYASDGDWVRLFARADGFLGTELLRPDDVPGRYITIDRWRSEEDFFSFQSKFGDDYRLLDEKLEGIAGAETRIGSFIA